MMMMMRAGRRWMSDAYLWGAYDAIEECQVSGSSVTERDRDRRTCLNGGADMTRAREMADRRTRLDTRDEPSTIEHAITSHNTLRNGLPSPLLMIYIYIVLTQSQVKKSTTLTYLFVFACISLKYFILLSPS